MCACFDAVARIKHLLFSMDQLLIDVLLFMTSSLCALLLLTGVDPGYELSPILLV